MSSYDFLPNFKEYDEIHSGTFKEFPVDLFGVISKVSRKQRIPYVSAEDDLLDSMHAVDFEMVNKHGTVIKCTAIGSYGDQLINELSERGFNYCLKQSEVFCVLRFWRVINFQGEISVISETGCSQLLIDPDIDELAEDKYINKFTSGFDSEDEEITTPSSYMSMEDFGAFY